MCVDFQKASDILLLQDETLDVSTSDIDSMEEKIAKCTKVLERFHAAEPKDALCISRELFVSVVSLQRQASILSMVVNDPHVFCEFQRLHCTPPSPFIVCPCIDLCIISHFHIDGLIVCSALALVAPELLFGVDDRLYELKRELFSIKSPIRVSFNPFTCSICRVQCQC
jgi:hypothetical protein